MDWHTEGGLRLALVMVLVCGSAACGSPSGDTPSGGTDDTTGNGGDTEQLSSLEKMFPIVEDGNFDAAGISQSFICIDDSEKTYFPLDFTADGKITQPETGESWTYRLNQNKLEIDLPGGLGGPMNYHHGYHTLAGKLVVGFVGAIADPNSDVTFACIASNHPYSDAVPDTTTIGCRSTSVDDRGTSFNSSTTNRFTLEPGHYAQRYFSSQSYESTYDPSGSFSISTYDEFYQHGTYLYDAQTGDFVMGFMKVDFDTPSVDLLVFYGETNGNDVNLSLADQNRGCVFE
ncbi:MAG TPA: hypothetical protein ENJ35_01490 [Gammaproteobacteria bacterium]|nr:hypothetical protein [Gammaproteobacteria bacterium]